MAFVAAFFGLLIICLGAVGVVSPPRLMAFVARWQSQRGLYLVAVIRIVFGVGLMLAASGSRAPEFLWILGIIALVAGVATPFFGVQRFQAVLGWWTRRPSSLIRLWCSLIVLLGASIVWAAAP
jgi:hypothetical protein